MVSRRERNKLVRLLNQKANKYRSHFIPYFVLQNKQDNRQPCFRCNFMITLYTSMQYKGPSGLTISPVQLEVEKNKRRRLEETIVR
jgi:hypothetical protein